MSDGEAVESSDATVITARDDRPDARSKTCVGSLSMPLMPAALAGSRRHGGGAAIRNGPSAGACSEAQVRDRCSALSRAAQRPARAASTNTAARTAPTARLAAEPAPDRRSGVTAANPTLRPRCRMTRWEVRTAGEWRSARAFPPVAVAPAAKPAVSLRRSRSVSEPQWEWEPVACRARSRRACEEGGSAGARRGREGARRRSAGGGWEPRLHRSSPRERGWTRPGAARRVPADRQRPTHGSAAKHTRESDRARRDAMAGGTLRHRQLGAQREGGPRGNTLSRAQRTALSRYRGKGRGSCTDPSRVSREDPRRSPLLRRHAHELTRGLCGRG